MKRGIRRFSVPADAALKDILNTLRQHVVLRAAPAQACRRQYFDSFDGLLYDADTVLFQETVGPAAHLRWTALGDNATHHTLATPDAPRFAHDLPPGRFRNELAPVLGYRALLPLAQIQYRRRVFRLLNDDGKTTARLIAEESKTATETDSGHSASLPTTLHVEPIKGYDAEARALSQALCRDLALPDHEADLLLEALDALGRTPGSSVPKAPPLDPTMRADEAVRQLLRGLLQTLERNEPGLRADLDTEFLHDYRVAVRRTRSVLGQLRDVLPPDTLAHYRPEFKWLGSITGPTRDLDVYLLKFERYQRWLPPRIQQDLIPLRDFLTARQRREHARLVEALDTPRYGALMDGWRAFLDGPAPDPPPSPEAVRPVREVVSARIWRIYKKILKEGQAIVDDPRTPAQALHDLRIRCKKLRYLLELFRSLYPHKAMKRLIKALKRLQDNLGDFNDFEVQQDTLQQFALQMMNDGQVQVETFLAMGRLEAYMEQRQRETRQEFAARFTRFADPRHHQLFKKLFQ